MDTEKSKTLKLETQDADQEEKPVRAGDWILDLFSPTYANMSDVLEGKHEVTEEGPRVKVVSAFDPQSIKHVYERVHMMIKMDEELKKQKHQAAKKHTAKTATSALERSVTESVSDDHKVDLRDSAIWNSEELSVLRNVFRAAKSQIGGLEVKVKQTQRHNAELEEMLAAQAKVLETKSKKLSEATKANHRLKIHCDQLQLELKETEMKREALTEMWQEIDQEKLRLMKETQDARVALDRERLAREQLEIQLREAHQEVTRERMLAEENTKTHYEHRILTLEEELRRLHAQLEGERQLHGKNRKALDHLRNHFASLPLHDVLPPGMVDRDQVPFIDHVGTL